MNKQFHALSGGQLPFFLQASKMIRTTGNPLIGCAKVQGTIGSLTTFLHHYQRFRCCYSTVFTISNIFDRNCVSWHFSKSATIFSLSSTICLHILICINYVYIFEVRNYVSGVWVKFIECVIKTHTHPMKLGANFSISFDDYLSFGANRIARIIFLAFC